MNALEVQVLPKPTLNNLIKFTPNGDIEREIFDKLDKTVLQWYLNDSVKYHKGYFYLGGQLKMSVDEEITLDKFDIVREIDKKKAIEYGLPYNGFEYTSVMHHKKLFYEIEEIVKCYLHIKSLREKQEQEQQEQEQQEQEQQEQEQQEIIMREIEKKGEKMLLQNIKEGKICNPIKIIAGIEQDKEKLEKSQEICLNIIKQGGDEFEKKIGRPMSYSEMRAMFG